MYTLRLICMNHLSFDHKNPFCNSTLKKLIKNQYNIINDHVHF